MLCWLVLIIRQREKKCIDTKSSRWLMSKICETLETKNYMLKEIFFIIFERIKIQSFSFYLLDNFAEIFFFFCLHKHDGQILIRHLFTTIFFPSLKRFSSFFWWKIFPATNILCNFRPKMMRSLFFVLYLKTKYFAASRFQPKLYLRLQTDTKNYAKWILFLLGEFL